MTTQLAECETLLLDPADLAMTHNAQVMGYHYEQGHLATVPLSTKGVVSHHVEWSAISIG